MKIIRNKLIEQKLSEADEITLSDINPSSDSVDKIAASIQGTVDEISDGEREVSDDSAKSAATEIKQAASEIDAGAVALDDSVAEDSEEALGVENALTHILDKALITARAGVRQGTRKNANVLVTGLPGSGKTSIVFDWANSRGRNINVYDVSAADPDLEAAVYGLTLRDMTATNKNATTKATSDFLDALDKPNSVLFLDEFNRANSKLRRALLMLVNEHCVNDKNAPNGLRYFNNLLFTVACINPGGLRTDKNAEMLNDAEKTRFGLKLSQFDSNTPTTIDYFNKFWDRLISKLNPADSHYMEDLEEYLRNQDLGLYIVSHPDFQYDSVDDLEDLSDLGKTMLNQRELTDGLNICAGNVDELKDWVENYSDFLDKDKEMLLKILNSYTVPRLQDLIDAKKQKGIKIDTSNADALVINPDEDQGSLENTEDDELEDEELEDDEDFFTSGTSNRKVMTPGEVETIILKKMQEWGI